MKRRFAWATATVLASLVIGVVVGKLAPHMAPVQQGTAILFWEGLCRADLNQDGVTPWIGDAEYIDDRWCVYDIQHIHGSVVYRAPTSDVAALLPYVSEQIETNSPTDLQSWVLNGHARWRDGTRTRETRNLVRSLREKRDQYWARRDASVFAFRIESRYELWNRWHSSKWYWATVVFDWAFLSGWVLFLLWPGIFGLKSWRWCLHLGLALPLFVLPVYLGYASYTFTSAGPTGGVLYPYLLLLLRGGSMSGPDLWLYEHIPPILDAISTPIGSPLALTGMGMPGILGLTHQGAVFAAITWIGYSMSKVTIRCYYDRYFSER